jgi:hypothetical protein
MAPKKIEVRVPAAFPTAVVALPMFAYATA